MKNTGKNRNCEIHLQFQIIIIKICEKAHAKIKNGKLYLTLKLRKTSKSIQNFLINSKRIPFLGIKKYNF